MSVVIKYGKSLIHRESIILKKWSFKTISFFSKWEIFEWYFYVTTIVNSLLTLKQTLAASVSMQQGKKNKIVEKN